MTTKNLLIATISIAVMTYASFGTAEDDPVFLHQIRKKAELVAQLYTESLRISDQAAAAEYRQVRRTAEKEWYTVFTTPRDTPGNCQRSLDAMRTLASLSLGSKETLGTVVFKKQYNEREETKHSWGDCSLSGEVRIGRKATDASHSMLFATVVHELGHAKIAKLIRERNGGMTLDAEREWLAKNRNQESYAREELIVESRARDCVKHIFNDGNPVTDATLKYSKHYVENWSSRLLSRFLGDRSWRSYRQCVKLSHAGAPGLVFGGIVLKSEVDHHLCSHGIRYNPVSYKFKKDEYGDWVIGITSKVTEQNTRCDCQRSLELTYKPWSTEDLWAAWHVIYPTKEMMSVAGVEGRESGLVSLSGSLCDYSIHPALGLVDIGQHALDLDHSLSRVFEPLPQYAKDSEGRPEVWVPVQCPHGRVHDPACLDVKRLREKLKSNSFSLVESIDLLSEGLAYGSRDGCMGYHSCVVSITQLLEVADVACGLQWVDKNVKSDASYDVDSQGTVTLPGLGLSVQALVPRTSSASEEAAQAFMKMLQDPDLIYGDLGGSLMSVYTVPLAENFPNIENVRSTYCFSRMQEFARTLAILRGLSRSCGDRPGIAWDEAMAVELESGPLRVDRGGEPSAAVMSAVVARHSDQQETDHWMRVGESYFKYQFDERGADAKVLFCKSANAYGVADRGVSVVTVSIDANKQIPITEIKTFGRDRLSRLAFADPRRLGEGWVPIFFRNPIEAQQDLGHDGLFRIDQRSVSSDGITKLTAGHPAVLCEEVLHSSLWHLVKAMSTGDFLDVNTVSSESPFMAKNGFRVIARGRSDSLVVDLRSIRIRCVDAERKHYEILRPSGMRYTQVERLVYRSDGTLESVERAAKEGTHNSYFEPAVSETEVARILVNKSLRQKVAVVALDSRIALSYGVCDIEMVYGEDVEDCAPGKKLNQIWTVVSNIGGRVVVRSSPSWHGVLTGTKIGKGSILSAIGSELSSQRDYNDLDYNDLSADLRGAFVGSPLELVTRERSAFSALILLHIGLDGWAWDEREPQPCFSSSVWLRRRGVCYHQSLLFRELLRGNGMPSVRVGGYAAADGDRFAIGHSWVEFMTLGAEPAWNQVDQTNSFSKLLYIPKATIMQDPIEIRFLQGNCVGNVGGLAEKVTSEKSGKYPWEHWYELGAATQKVLLSVGDSESEAWEQLFRVCREDRVPLQFSAMSESCALDTCFGACSQSVALRYGDDAGAAFALGAISASLAYFGESDHVPDVSGRHMAVSILSKLLYGDESAHLLISRVRGYVDALGVESLSINRWPHEHSSDGIRRLVKSVNEECLRRGCSVEALR